MVDDGRSLVVGDPGGGEPDVRIGMLGVIATEVEVEKDRHAVLALGEIQQDLGGRCVGGLAQLERGLQPHRRDVAGERDVGPFHVAHHFHRCRRQPPSEDELFQEFELVRPHGLLPGLG